MPRVERIKGRVVVSRSGAIIFNYPWSFRSVYKNVIVFLKVYIISISSLLIRRRVKLRNDNIYGVVHSIWTAGYYHWITECLPRVLVLKEAFPDAILLLPRGRYENYSDSLKALGVNKVDFYPSNSNVILDSPVLTECAPRFGTSHPAILCKIRDVVAAHTDSNIDITADKIVYVSRAKSRGRFILNESVLVDSLQKLGVESVHFEDLDFFEQVRLMRHCRCLISIHGAALTNMIFMPAGGFVLEIVPEKRGLFDFSYVRRSLKHDGCYVRLASALGHIHMALAGKPDGRFYSRTHMSNLSVDVKQICEVINKLKMS